MKKITLTSKGVVNIYASALSKGTYDYTLSVEGKLVESKRMVVTH